MKKAFVFPKKDLVDKMAQALDVNPYTLYDTAGRDASEMMELCFSGWMNLTHLPCICFSLGDFPVKNAMK